MKITNITDIGHSYMIMQDNGFGFMQRKHPKTADSATYSGTAAP